MILEIDDNKTVGDLQERFSMCFPGLKLEVCTHKHGWEDFCPEKEFLPVHFHVGTVRKTHDPGRIEIKSWNKVGEVEKDLYKLFGLNAQICYRAGERWIQSGKSDNLTIGELQKKAYKRPHIDIL
jgi:hypothetical protein